MKDGFGIEDFQFGQQQEHLQNETLNQKIKPIGTSSDF